MPKEEDLRAFVNPSDDEVYVCVRDLKNFIIEILMQSSAAENNKTKMECAQDFLNIVNFTDEWAREHNTF